MKEIKTYFQIKDIYKNKDIVITIGEKKYDLDKNRLGNLQKFFLSHIITFNHEQPMTYDFNLDDERIQRITRIFDMNKNKNKSGVYIFGPDLVKIYDVIQIKENLRSICINHLQNEYIKLEFEDGMAPHRLLHSLTQYDVTIFILYRDQFVVVKNGIWEEIPSSIGNTYAFLSTMESCEDLKIEELIFLMFYAFLDLKTKKQILTMINSRLIQSILGYISKDADPADYASVLCCIWTIDDIKRFRHMDYEDAKGLIKRWN
jgi:hypothetical protein